MIEIPPLLIGDLELKKTNNIFINIIMLEMNNILMRSIYNFNISTLLDTRYKFELI